MKFLANENIPRASVLFLRDAGLDIVAIGDGFSGISDREVISFANEEGRTILTFDSDYGELIFKNGLKVGGGVIYLRIPMGHPQFAAEAVLSILDGKGLVFENTLTVLDPDKVRQRRY